MQVTKAQNAHLGKRILSRKHVLHKFRFQQCKFGKFGLGRQSDANLIVCLMKGACNYRRVVSYLGGGDTLPFSSSKNNYNL